MWSTPSIKTNYGTFDVSGCEFLNIIWNRVMDFKIIIPQGTTKMGPMIYMYDNMLTVEMKVASTSLIKKIVRNFESSSQSCPDWIMYGDGLEIRINFPTIIVRENSSFIRIEAMSPQYVISRATDDYEPQIKIRL